MSEIELHRKLLGDVPRNQAFYDALKAVIIPHKSTVADLGAGTGFLSFLARKLGASHCTLIEYTDTLDLAQDLARLNKIDGLTFIKGHSAAIKKLSKVDIVVSETLGNYALEENLLETLVDARRFLKPKGVMIPCGLKQYIAPVFTPRLQSSIDIWPNIGFDLNLQPARQISLNNMYVRSIVAEDIGGSDQYAQIWDDLQFASGDAPPSLRRKSLHYSGKVLGSTRIYGYALWWTADLGNAVSLSTSPFTPSTHWEQIYLPLLEPISLDATSVLELTLTSDTRPDIGVRVGWRSRILKDGNVVLSFDQDTTQGRI